MYTNYNILFLFINVIIYNIVLAKLEHNISHLSSIIVHVSTQRNTIYSTYE